MLRLKSWYGKYCHILYVCIIWRWTSCTAPISMHSFSSETEFPSAGAAKPRAWTNLSARAGRQGPLNWNIPSGKHTKNYGQSPFFMGKLTISMAIFNSYFDITRGRVQWLEHVGSNANSVASQVDTECPLLLPGHRAIAVLPQRVEQQLKKTCFNIKTSVKWGLPSFHCEFFYRNGYKYCIYETKSKRIDQPLMWRVFLGDGSNMECLLGPTNLSHILSIQPNGIQSVLSQPCLIVTFW